jgi:transglutaminase-like putative cysteine protease
MRFLKLSVSLLLTAGTLVALEPGDVQGLTPGPASGWVERLEWKSAAKPAPAGIPGEILISDSQTNLTLAGSDYYFRTVTRLLNSEGVRQNAEVSVIYSPEYQRVTWHLLQLIRNDQVIDLLPVAKFRQLQRELGFEAKIYDGQITAAAVLEGVRVGDILEMAYTIHDTNPLLAGHLSSRHHLGSSYPVRRQTVIVRTPATAKPLTRYMWIPPATTGLPDSLFNLAELHYPVREETTDQERIYRWEAREVPAIDFDGNISGQAAPYYPMLRWSSFRTWADVVNWATPLFESGGPLPPAIGNQLAAWRERLPSPAQRLRAAVDWAQGDVRYFAMAMGSHNLKPRPLAEICATGFGDCKDKSVLLVAMLRELGFKAWPALVHSYAQDKLREDGPDPYAFNHAIVAYEHEDRLHWVDPTLKQPAGVPGQWAVPAYRVALLLREGEVRLTPVSGPTLDGPDTVTLDRITVDAEGNAELATRVIIRGLEADFYRLRLEAMSASETSKRWFNYISQFYRRLEEVRAPVVTDDRAHNSITIEAQYRLPGFRTSEGSRTGVFVYAYAMRAMMNPPESRRRHWPYGLPADRHVRQEIEVTLPDQPPIDQRPQVITTPAMVYTSTKGLSGNRLKVTHDLKFVADYVPAADMGIFADSAEEIINDFSTAVLRDAAAPAKP